MKIQKRPDVPAGQWAGDHSITIHCLCGRRYDSPRGQYHACPHCRRVYDSMEPGQAMTPAAEARLKRWVKDAWARRERSYPPVPDLKTPWPCGKIPYPPDPDL